MDHISGRVLCCVRAMPWRNGRAWTCIITDEIKVRRETAWYTRRDWIDDSSNNQL